MLDFYLHCFTALLTLKTFSLFMKPNPEYVDCKLFKACKKEKKDFSYFVKCSASDCTPQDEIHFLGNDTKYTVFK